MKRLRYSLWLNKLAEYAMWRIKFYEDASIKKSKKITGVKDLIRFTPKRGVKH